MLSTSMRVAKANARNRPLLARLIELLCAGDWRTWSLSLLLLGLMAVTVLSYFHPMDTWYHEEFLVQEIRLTLGSTAPLLALFTALFIQMRLNAGRLQEQLVRAHLFMEAAERNADSRAFAFIPGIRQFRDALAMEYKRASASNCGLSLVLFSAGSPSPEVMGKIIQLLHFTLDPGYSVGRISTTTIAVLLPDTSLDEAKGVAARIEEHIGTFAPEIEVYSTVAAYPQQAACLAELEAPIRHLINENKPASEFPRMAVVRAIR